MRQLRAVLCIALLVCSCLQLANARQLKQGKPPPVLFAFWKASFAYAPLTC
jgi:hypothetical protein